MLPGIEAHPVTRPEQKAGEPSGQECQGGNNLEVDQRSSAEPPEARTGSRARHRANENTEQNGRDDRFDQTEKVGGDHGKGLRMPGCNPAEERSGKHRGQHPCCERRTDWPDHGTPPSYD